MQIKNIVKNALGYFRCKIKGICPGKRIYIGGRVHVIGGDKISLGNDVQIRPDVDLFAGERFCIGDGVDIGTRNRIAGNVVIEDKVLFGPDNYICSSDHVFEDISVPIIEQGAKSINKNGHGYLKIGKGSWIGTHCAIIGDVHIGRNCVVGANTVVTKDIPDYSVVAGNPAKVIKRYNINKGEWERV